MTDYFIWIVISLIAYEEDTSVSDVKVEHNEATEASEEIFDDE